MSQVSGICDRGRRLHITQIRPRPVSGPTHCSAGEGWKERKPQECAVGPAPWWTASNHTGPVHAVYALLSHLPEFPLNLPLFSYPSCNLLGSAHHSFYRRGSQAQKGQVPLFVALETSWTRVCLTLGDEVTSTESVYVTSVASEESKIAIYARRGLAQMPRLLTWTLAFKARRNKLLFLKGHLAQDVLLQRTEEQGSFSPVCLRTSLDYTMWLRAPPGVL